MNQVTTKLLFRLLIVHFVVAKKFLQTQALKRRALIGISVIYWKIAPMQKNLLTDGIAIAS